MIIKMTDPGLYPLEVSAWGPEDWNYIFGFLKKYNTKYTCAIITNDHGDIIFRANRNVGEQMWKCEYLSD